MGNRKLAIQIHSVHCKEDVDTQVLENHYLTGNFTEFEIRRKKQKIQRLVGIDVGEQMVKAVIVEWKDHHIPESELLTEYREVCEQMAIERQHSTVTPQLQTKLNQLEDIILQQLE